MSSVFYRDVCLTDIEGLRQLHGILFPVDYDEVASIYHILYHMAEDLTLILLSDMVSLCRIRLRFNFCIYCC